MVWSLERNECGKRMIGWIRFPAVIGKYSRNFSRILGIGLRFLHFEITLKFIFIWFKIIIIIIVNHLFVFVENLIVDVQYTLPRTPRRSLFFQESVTLHIRLSVSFCLFSRLRRVGYSWMEKMKLKMKMKKKWMECLELEFGNGEFERRKFIDWKALSFCGIGN